MPGVRTAGSKAHIWHISTGASSWSRHLDSSESSKRCLDDRLLAVDGGEDFVAGGFAEFTLRNNSGKLVLPLIQLDGWQSSI